MNKVATSKEAILAASRTIVMEKGISAVSMRSVADACSVAVGSLYNYFPSKADLLSAAVADVWRDIFHLSGDCTACDSFSSCLALLFESIREGCAKYPGFFTFHSVTFTAGDKEKGRLMMQQYFGHIKESLLCVLKNDRMVRPDAFNGSLNAESFVDIIFTLFTSMLLKEQYDYKPVLEIVARCIY